MALLEIATQLNHSYCRALDAIPYEVHFNAKSHFSNDMWIPHHRRRAIRVRIEGVNEELDAGAIYERGRLEAEARSEATIARTPSVPSIAKHYVMAAVFRSLLLSTAYLRSPLRL